MERYWLDYMLAGVQIVSLVFLIIYVVKTWHMASATRESAEISSRTLKEMREARIQEVAPYVVIYFDMPYGQSIIYLVVKNVGKSSAYKIKFQFEPRLKNSYEEEDEIGEIVFLTEGIPSLPPGHEIRTYFDEVHSYLGSSLPLTYRVKLSYFGGLSPEIQTTDQIIDLSAYKGTFYTPVKGMDKLVEEVENLVRAGNDVGQRLKTLVENLNSGIWIKNPSLTSPILQSGSAVWKSSLSAKLMELKLLWQAIDAKQLDGSEITELKNYSNILRGQIRYLIASAPSGISNELLTDLIEVTTKLSELHEARYRGNRGAVDDKLKQHKAELIVFVDRIVDRLQLRVRWVRKSKRRKGEAEPPIDS